jgi:hypothetical protein
MLTFEMSKQYIGTGISNGLDRGLLVSQNGDLLLDEGMGLGALAVQSEGMNYFATISHMTELQEQIEVVLTIDKMLLRTIYGIHSKPLTRFIEKVCTNMYKERERGQGIWFIIGNWINFLLQIKVCFIQVPAKGQFVLNYQILPEEIHIDLNGNLEEAVDKIYVMNELSGRLFHDGIKDGEMMQPPSGWQQIEGENQLYSEERGLTFSTKELEKPELLESRLYWGRETDKNHCWAGFIYELQTEISEFEHFKYTVQILERG